MRKRIVMITVCIGAAGPGRAPGRRGWCRLAACTTVRSENKSDLSRARGQRW